ncbi:MAG: 50S ribosomal protein L21 [Rhodomicrobium sp.]|nr:50S ribosomal protein L21 [Rhodomicrobium sp.]
MYAVIRTGGKQYKVAPQDVLQIEKIEGAAGDAVQFPDVLMVGGEGEPRFGTPLVSGTVVSAEVVEQGRGPKVIIFKKRRRQNYRRKRGHRQELTTVRILEIGTAKAAPAKATAETNAVEAAPAPAPEAPVKKAKAAKPKVAKDAGAAAEAAPKKPRAKKAE